MSGIDPRIAEILQRQAAERETKAYRDEWKAFTRRQEEQRLARIEVRQAAEQAVRDERERLVDENYENQVFVMVAATTFLPPHELLGDFKLQDIWNDGVTHRSDGAPRTFRLLEVGDTTLGSDLPYVANSQLVMDWLREKLYPEVLPQIEGIFLEQNGIRQVIFRNDAVTAHFPIDFTLEKDNTEIHIMFENDDADPRISEFLLLARGTGPGDDLVGELKANEIWADGNTAHADGTPMRARAFEAGDVAQGSDLPYIATSQQVASWVEQQLSFVIFPQVESIELVQLGETSLLWEKGAENDSFLVFFLNDRDTTHIFVNFANNSADHPGYVDDDESQMDLE